MPNKRLGTAELPFLSISKQILLSRKYRFSQISSIKDLSFICNSNKSKARVSPWITPPSACPYSFLPPDAAYHHPVSPREHVLFLLHQAGAEVHPQEQGAELEMDPHWDAQHLSLGRFRQSWALHKKMSQATPGFQI